MSSDFLYNLKTMLALLSRDLRIQLFNLRTTIENTIIIVFFGYLNYGYFLPLLGMKQELIVPVFLGIVIFMFFSVAFRRALLEAIDLKDHHLIRYQVILPLSKNWLIIKYVCSFFSLLFLSSFPIFIFAKILLGVKLNLFFLIRPSFWCTYLVSLFFVSTFFLFLIFKYSYDWFSASFWPRVLLPMEFFGCTLYTWKNLNLGLPNFAKWILLNPMTYVNEGIRASILNDSVNYISPWICVLVLLFFSLFNVVFLNYTFKSRLDLP